MERIMIGQIMEGLVDNTIPNTWDFILQTLRSKDNQFCILYLFNNINWRNISAMWSLWLGDCWHNARNAYKS